MKASVIHQYGGPEVLKYEDVADPVPAAGEVLVRVAAASINPVDLLQSSGETRAYMPVEFPGVIGWDLSGTVQALGAEVSDFKVGDRVFGWAFHTFAELCAVKADLLARIPDGLDLIDSAALPLVGTTGSQLISVAADVQAGQTVLVSGALGSVGRSAVFTAKDRGAFVIAGVTGKQLEQADVLGADQVVVLDVVEAFNALLPVDVVANCVRGKTAEMLLGKVKPGGAYVSVTGAPANTSEYPAVRVQSFVSKQSRQTLNYVAQGALAGKLSIAVGRRIPLSDAATGMAAVAAGGIGKVLLIP